MHLPGLLGVHPADKEEKKRMRDSIEIMTRQSMEGDVKAPEKETKTAEAYTIAVFFGGCSTEYEVSLQSACSVILNIDPDR